MDVTINEKFQVEEPIEKVWNFFINPHKMVVCMPGAALTEEIDERNFKGNISIKIGPILTKYDGLATIEEQDPVAKKLKLVGNGIDSKGQGSASMVLTGELRELDNKTTEIKTSMKVSITGKIAQLGSRMIKAVSKEMFNKFRANLIENLEKSEDEQLIQTESKPIGAMTLVLIVTLKAITSPFVRFFKWITRRSSSKSDHKQNVSG
ncbi:MAG: hypothetical protein HeimC2_33420 [Candidatus Heimdallarchaeota archaeon LC_2]|nr:MAG: hypothetical protein HeimC2_33420 [Candidatus Heimdallarchaeota archaeon LC_2]